ncbi:MAG TPA: hypothetical protein VFH10_10155 [Nocardioides sp.]|uniref:hypothetical protein n=1 Tax=Nocardioides sp. TaxID=35761 RepID=UPI002D803E61|nr:hypothetical protein [Nocardioides sp.]HET6652991.1 hypothetical protein [Nocardioides sp.]
MLDSTIYTIGTALNRARDNDVAVQVLVEGQWLTGRIAAVDGHGVVLHCDDLGHAVLRMERVSAVRIASELPGRTPIPTAHAMPAPRQPSKV